MESVNPDKSFLVDGKYAIEDLVDMDPLRQLCEMFTQATGFTIGFLDHPGLNVLIATGWRDICTKFHRMCPLGLANCEKSNRHLLDQLDEPGKLVIEACENGLVDCATPIIIKGKHIASLATGQLLLQEPDLERFKKQAQVFGFDEAEYLKALAEIPVVDEEKLKTVTAFLGEMARAISQMGYTRLLVEKDSERMAIEIGERIRAEESLKSKTALLEAQTNSSLDGILVIDEKQRRVLVNHRIPELFNVPPHILDDEDDTKLLEHVVNMTRNPEKFREKVMYLYDHVTETSRDEIEFKNGMVLDRYSAPVLDKDGKYYGRIWTFRDITERKRSEETLKKNVEKFAKVFLQNAIPMAISAIKDGRYIDVSDAFLEWSGQDRGTVIGNTAIGLGLLEPEQRALILKEYTGKGRVENLELQIKTKRGDVRDVIFNATGIRIADEDYLLSLITDITERKKAEQEKLQLEAQLMQAQKVESIGTLAGGIAHDFNNILYAIIGNAQLALSDLSDPEKVREELQEVLNASDRAKNLVNQILTFSRKAEAKYSSISLHKTVMDSIKMMRSVLPTTITIRHDLLDNGRVMADSTQIQQIMMNLCTNAAHAMDKTGGVIEIRLRRIDLDGDLRTRLDLPPGAYLRLSVSDTGHGMSPDVIAKIFDPYFTTKEVGRGTGLGLAVVHGIVRSHGGAITCMSSPGKGTTFDIFLPEILSEENKVRHSEKQPLPTGNERILFVDDEAALVRLAENMLSRLGYSVVTSSSSPEALELFRKDPGKYDLVITDMTMPGMTGDQLAREIMDIRQDIPVVLCSGYTEHISEEKASEMGIRAFVMKPVIMKDLATTIRKVLDQN